MSGNLKEKAFKIVKQRNLCSYMNDTKWSELRSAMLNDMPFPPPYAMKTLFEDCGEDISEDVYHIGDWYEGFCIGEYFNGGFAVEWIKVRTRILKYRGLLISPEVLDETAEFVGVLKKYNIHYEEKDGIYTIYGYR
ncbi:MAG: hypothetical protein K2J40_06435 [Ruminococcus sp.]|nr:hypothetical protein [Ruminococcus sp.]